MTAVVTNGCSKVTIDSSLMHVARLHMLYSMLVKGKYIIGRAQSKDCRVCVCADYRLYEELRTAVSVYVWER